MPDEKRACDDLVKVEVSVSAATVDAINELAAMQGISAAEALVRAIGRDRYFVQAAKRGDRVLVEDPARKSFKKVEILD